MNERWLSVIVAVLVALVVGSATWGVNRIKLRNRTSLRLVLNSVLNATHETLIDWEKRTANDALVWARVPEVRDAVRNLQGRGRAASERALDRVLYPVLHAREYLGYEILDLNGNRIAGVSGFVTQHPELFRNSPNLVLPFQWDGRPAMAITVPVQDENGRPVAILVFLIDPMHEFSDVFRTAWNGENVIVYAFNHDAQIISDNKLRHELVQDGLIRSNQSTVLTIGLRDPGGDLSAGYRPDTPQSSQPLTELAKNALTGAAGFDLDGYRDYRGKIVIGAWEWDPELDIGIAVEALKDDAFGPYNIARDTIQWMVVVILTALLGLLAYLWRQSRSFYKAIGELSETEGTLKGEIELRNEFIAVASHELKTPLTPIRMELALIDRLGKAGTLADYPQDKLLMINDLSIRETERINEIIQNYLDVSRITSGHFPLEVKKFDLISLVNDTVRHFLNARSIEEKQVRVFGPPEVTVFWDAYRIEQILTLLLSNAVKFGGGKPIEILIDSAGDDIKLTITNHGPTLSKEDQEKIFERFEKAESDRIMRGLGVGLYIVKRIAEDHGGTVHAESVPGGGTAFILDMPRIVAGTAKSA